MTDFAADLDPANAEDPVRAWEQPLRQPPWAGAAPVLAVDGFEGPLDWLLEMARAQRIDLTKLSILALVEAFTGALDTALMQSRARRVDLSRWGEWLVMAATLAHLRSRLLLPKDAPEARAAQDEAEALRRVLVERTVMQRVAEWLERRPQLGRNVFARGGVGEGTTATSRVADITDLFRACLVVLRVPEQADAYQLRRVPFWRVTDAVARITHVLADRPGGGGLALFLPAVDASAPERELRCRTALASTFVAGLELAREGEVSVEQHRAWQGITVVRRGFEEAVPRP